METTYDAVVLAAGNYPTHPAALAVLQQTRYVVCCDGAAQAYINHGCTPQAIVGDGDSLPDDIRKRYASIIHIVDEQEYNDLSKATRHCLSMGFKRIAYLGCTGRREDHTMGNISLMSFYRREWQVDPIMFTDHGVFLPANGTRSFPSHSGQQISIFRVRCNHLSGEGLRWHVYTYDDLWQGTLNEALGNTFTIHSDGEYIIFQTYE